MATYNCIYYYPKDKWEAREIKVDGNIQLYVLEQDYDYVNNGRRFSMFVEETNKADAITNAKRNIVDVINNNIKGLQDLKIIILGSSGEFLK